MPSQSTTRILPLSCTSEYSPRLSLTSKWDEGEYLVLFFELSGGGNYLWYVNSWFLAVHFLMKNWCVAFQLRREICLICLPVPTSLCRICTILGTSMNSNGASVVIPLPTLTVVTVSASSTPSMSVMLVLWENIRDYGLWLYQLLLRW